MASEYSAIKKSTMKGIANAVREKTNTTADIPTLNMEGMIRSIKSDPKLQFKGASVAYGATVWVSPDEGYDGLSEVSVVGEKPKTNSATVTPTTKEQVVYPDANSGSYFLETVTVKAVPLEEKTVTPTTAVQVFTPSEGKLGFSKVTVNAAEGGGGGEELQSVMEVSF